MCSSNCINILLFLYRGRGLVFLGYVTAGWAFVLKYSHLTVSVCVCFICSMLYMYVPVCVRVRGHVLEVLQNIRLKICVQVNRQTIR